ncbi:hypothetical protein M407DRAFT_32039 [Tulasnella calospora MUT 4182]|uniref:Uncharacterized protein n=1 Tax=Tulasnella calospora MUT 4182 TaxID=1051891 RepID=A0A0C3KA43_9AGAM|nr:hypothetical protein M407DRAFT_32039 [Tulasnella calospora MUT 4182]
MSERWSDETGCTNMVSHSEGSPLDQENDCTYIDPWTRDSFQHPSAEGTLSAVPGTTIPSHVLLWVHDPRSIWPSMRRPVSSPSRMLRYGQLKNSPQ